MQGLLISERIYISKDHKFFLVCESARARKNLKKNTIIIKTVIRPEGILIIKQGVLG